MEFIYTFVFSQNAFKIRLTELKMHKHIKLRLGKGHFGTGRHEGINRAKNLSIICREKTVPVTAHL